MCHPSQATRPTPSACQEREHYRIAGRDFDNIRSYALDDSCAFVAKHDWMRYGVGLITIVRPDGTIINTRSIGHPILDERGEVVEFVGASIDVTEHHRAAQALRRSEAYLAEAQRLAKMGSWAYNPAAEKAMNGPRVAGFVKRVSQRSR